MTREEAVARIKDHKAIHKMDEPRAIYISEALNMAIESLENQKTGHWITKIKSDLRGDMWPTNPKCSECGGEPYYSNTIYNYKFCPYCGAKMVESQESELENPFNDSRFGG